ncbi:MAG: ABC transporter substrate-binding protein [Oscillospiraceae bacterium]|nr:ABC transporter substrate-binding protein [Oscillospiraceae bacterium]
MKKQLGRLLAAACLLAVCAGCRGGREANGTVRFVLDWTPNTNHTGLYVAQDKGYFEDEGLTVEIMQPPEDGALVLLGAGDAEFAVGVQEGLGPAIARAADALPVTAVAAIICHNTSGLMSLRESGVARPRDLEGKRFATWETPLVDAVIRRIVEADGGVFENVKMIPNHATDAFSALQTDVDSIWIYYAWDGIAAEINNIDATFLDLGQLDPTLDFYTPVIVTNTNYAAANPDEVRAFLRAVSRGYRFAIENPDEAADILLRYAPELDETLVRRSQTYLAARYQADAPRWGEIDPARWGAFYAWMYENGLLEEDIRDRGFTNEYLPT